MSQHAQTETESEWFRGTMASLSDNLRSLCEKRSLPCERFTIPEWRWSDEAHNPGWSSCRIGAKWRTDHPMNGYDAGCMRLPPRRFFGSELIRSGERGCEITEVSGYQFPEPGTDTPVPKVSFVTAVAIWVAASATTSRCLSRSVILLTTRWRA
jgi:hypothetical protein